MWVTGFFLLAAILALGVPDGATAQAQSGELTNLFFDCQAPGCYDLDFFRREAPFVNWVRDRESADVHVLVTSETTGGGGRSYTLAFFGLRDFLGDDREVRHQSAGDATTDEQRNGLVEKLRLGLVRYVQGTSAADQLRVTFGEVTGPRGPGPPGGRPGGPPGGGPGGGPGGAASAQDDPWDFWVFRINTNGFVNGQSTSKFSNYFGNLNASRTTEAWKLSLGSNYSQNVQQFEIPDGGGGFRTVKETREDWGADAFAVRSLGEQWAIGVRANAGSSTFLNQDFRWSLQPGIEYNFFPYSESSRRSLTLQYLAGPNHFNYTEETIFFETSETRPQQSVTGRISLVEPWGRWSTSVTGSQYLHDTSKYNVAVSGYFNVRLFRGFSVRVSGNYSWIRDQLYISAAGATEEQILLQQRQLGTSYRYFTSFGFEYRFGSIFNNVVNPRFGGNGGGDFIIFGD